MFSMDIKQVFWYWIFRHDGHTEMKNICGGQADLLFVPEQHNISMFDAVSGNT